MRQILIPLGLLISSLGCGSDTGRYRVAFDVEVSAVNGAGPHLNEHGWSVTLTQAKLVAGPLYFFEGEPLFTKWIESLFISTAYAHPGHYVEGDALADVLVSHTVDLLSGEKVLLPGTGVTGAYNSVRFEATATGQLEGHTAMIAGTATKGDQTVGFSGTFDLPKPIEGIAFGADVTKSGHVKLGIDLAEWVRRIDFALVTDELLQPGTQPHNALVRGIENTTAFHFSWVE